jgi:hypothetical protein
LECAAAFVIARARADCEESGSLLLFDDSLLEGTKYIETVAFVVESSQADWLERGTIY